MRYSSHKKVTLELLLVIILNPQHLNQHFFVLHLIKSALATSSCITMHYKMITMLLIRADNKQEDYKTLFKNNMHSFLMALHVQISVQTSAVTKSLFRF